MREAERSFLEPLEGAALPTPGSQMSGLHVHDSVNVCPLSPRSASLLWWPQQTTQLAHGPSCMTVHITESISKGLPQVTQEVLLFWGPPPPELSSRREPAQVPLVLWGWAFSHLPVTTHVLSSRNKYGCRHWPPHVSKEGGASLRHEYSASCYSDTAWHLSDFSLSTASSISLYWSLTTVKGSCLWRNQTNCSGSWVGHHRGMCGVMAKRGP